MSKLSDILHLRERGMWPGNTIPQWALDASAAESRLPDDAALLLDAAVSEAVRLRDAAQDTQNEYQAGFDSVRAEYRALRLLATPVRFSRRQPPVGPLLVLISPAGVGVGRLQADLSVSVLWSEPAGLTSFVAWVNLSALLAGS